MVDQGFVLQTGSVWHRNYGGKYLCTIMHHPSPSTTRACGSWSITVRVPYDWKSVRLMIPEVTAGPHDAPAQEALDATDLIINGIVSGAINIFSPQG